MDEQTESLTVICENILRSGGTLDDLPREKIPKLSDVLNESLGRTDKPIKLIAELSGINNATIHRILNGEMHPTRNTLLRLALILEMPFETTQVLLKSGTRSTLSGGRDRDLIIMQGIIKKSDIATVCEDLAQNGFHDLYSKQDF